MILNSLFCVSYLQEILIASDFGDSHEVRVRSINEAVKFYGDIYPFRRVIDFMPVACFVLYLVAVWAKLQSLSLLTELEVESNQFTKNIVNGFWFAAIISCSGFILWYYIRRLWRHRVHGYQDAIQAHVGNFNIHTMFWFPMFDEDKKGDADKGKDNEGKMNSLGLSFMSNPDQLHPKHVLEPVNKQDVMLELLKAIALEKNNKSGSRKKTVELVECDNEFLQHRFRNAQARRKAHYEFRIRNSHKRRIRMNMKCTGSRYPLEPSSKDIREDIAEIQQDIAEKNNQLFDV